MYCCLFISDLSVTWGWPGYNSALWRGENLEQSVEFQGRPQYAAGISAVNIETGTIRDLFSSVYGNSVRQSDTNPSHATQIPPTIPTHNAALTFLLSVHHLYTPTRSIHTQTLTQSPLQCASWVEQKQFRLKRRYSAISVNAGEVQLNFSLQRKYPTHNITVSVQIPLCCH